MDWIYGLLKAFIGGGAGAVTSTFAASMIAPETFNFSGGMHKVVELMCATFATNGLLNFFYYLKSSPLPEIVEEQSKRIDAIETRNEIKNSEESK